MKLISIVGLTVLATVPFVSQAAYHGQTGKLPEGCVPGVYRDDDDYLLRKFRELLKHFWWQWGSIDNYWGQPVALGATGKDGKSLMNEVTWIVLDVHDQLNLPTPKMLVKVAKTTPRKYYANLQVRVCGWNVHWNDLSKAEQDSYIRRAENQVQ